MLIPSEPEKQTSLRLLTWVREVSEGRAKYPRKCSFALQYSFR
jgi:hypothetical protein